MSRFEAAGDKSTDPVTTATAAVMVIEELATPWPATTNGDYKFVDSDRKHPDTSTASTPGSIVDRNMVFGDSTTTTTWPSLLVTALVDNITELVANGTDMLGAVGNGSYNQSLLTNDTAMDLCDVRNENFNCSVQDYMTYTLGPQTLPVQQAIIVSIT